MGWVPVLVVVLLVAPLYAMGELGIWSFDEPRSHLRWDEAGGTDAPQPADEPGGAGALWGRLAAGGLIVAGLSLLGRREG